MLTHLHPDPLAHVRALDAVHKLTYLQSDPQAHIRAVDAHKPVFSHPDPSARLRAVDAMHKLHLQAQAPQLRQREVCLGLVARQRDEVRLPGHLRVLVALARPVAEAVPCLRTQSLLHTEQPCPAYATRDAFLS